MPTATASSSLRRCTDPTPWSQTNRVLRRGCLAGRKKIEDRPRPRHRSTSHNQVPGYIYTWYLGTYHYPTMQLPILRCSSSPRPNFIGPESSKFQPNFIIFYLTISNVLLRPGHCFYFRILKISSPSTLA